MARVETRAQIPQRYVWFTPGDASLSPSKSASKGKNELTPGAVYPAVTVTVTKKPGQNAVDVSRAVGERIKALGNTIIPANIEATITRDYGETAAEKANKLIQKLAFATSSVIFLVGFMPGRRSSDCWGSRYSDVDSYLVCIVGLRFTLNRVSLFALIFSIGILVDDAIVVVENIHRHQQLTPGAVPQRHHPPSGR